MKGLAAEVFSRFGPYEQILDEWFVTPGVATLLAEEEEEPVGLVMVALFQRSWGGLSADVLAIAVEPAHQGKGLGGRLLDRVLEVTADAELAGTVQEVGLTVADTNSVARKLFGSRGFRLVEGLESDYPGGQAALRMVRRVGPPPFRRG